MNLQPRDRLIVALDVPAVADAERIVETLGDAATFYKIGYQLAFNGGLDFAAELAAAGYRVFLDLKLHDIANTVSKGVEQIAQMGATFLTVHAYPQTMRAAMEGARGSDLRILGVTVLTSFDDNDLSEAGYAHNVDFLVKRRAHQAIAAGVPGLVCSAEEAASLKADVGQSLFLVTPGIRPAGAEPGDQKRVMTPARAIASGADFLVVGRPIVAARQPRAAAQAIVDEIAGAQAEAIG
jgi:orotidine-5'-phosphate decarboxylase